MKKAAVFFGVILLVAGAGFARKISLRAGVGFGSVFGGDVSAGIQGLSDYLADASASTGSFSAPGFGLNLSVEAVYRLNDTTGAGLGLGFFSAGKESEAGYSLDSIAVTQALHPRFSVIPVTASFHYRLAAALGRLDLDLSAGLGLYLARFKYDETIGVTIGSEAGALEYTYASGGRTGFGPHLGLSAEYPLTDKLALTVGLTARLASVTLASGDWTETGSGLFGGYTNQGSDHQPWAFDWTTGGKTYRQLLFGAVAPAGTGVANVREAKLGLSAVVFGVGARFNL